MKKHNRKFRRSGTGNQLPIKHNQKKPLTLESMVNFGEVLNGIVNGEDNLLETQLDQSLVSFTLEESNLN